MNRYTTAGPVLAAVLLAACGEPARMPEGVAVVAVSADADVLVPALSQTSVGFAVGDQLFLRLAEMGPELNTVGDQGFIPELAESWEFEDSLTIVFQLHPDATWHDGRAVTAEDVAFTFAFYRDTLVGANARPLLSSIDSVVVRNVRSVAFHFARPYAEQFYDAVHHMWILPRHVLESVPPAELRSHPSMRAPVGAGPYRFSRWQPGELIEVVADTAFFRGGAGIARLIWRITPDFNTAITQITAGEADIFEAVVGPPNVERVQQAEGVRLVDYPSPAYVYVGFNMRAPGSATRPHPLLSDPSLRRALTLATNRDAMVQAVLAGRGEVPRGPITPMIWLWENAPRQPAYDSAGAAAALEAAGWRDSDGDGMRERRGRPLRIDLLVPSSSGIRRATAVILQDQWRRVGVDLRLVELEFNTFISRSESGRFDAYLGALNIDPTPSGIRQLWTSEGIGGSNYGAYASTAFDSLVTAATRAADLDAARSLWVEALETINADAPAIWLFTPSLAAAVSDRLENVVIRPDLWSAFLWDWTVAPASN